MYYYVLMGIKEQLQESFHAFHFIGGRVSHFCYCDTYFLWWLMSFWKIIYLFWDYRCEPLHSAFYVDSEDLYSGHQACVTSIFIH